MNLQSPLNMNRSKKLKECLEAREFATLEFNRVKQVKLENEKKKSSKLEGQKDDKQLYRERCNRASAAASRAKIVFYSKELEKRTDKLEMERNREIKRADRASRKIRMLQEEVRNLKKALRDIWEMKDQRTCSYLMDSEALFLLSSKQEETDLSMGNYDSDSGDDSPPKQIDTSNATVTNSQSPSLQMFPPRQTNSIDIGRKRDNSHLSAPAKTVSTIQSLVNPTSVEPVIRGIPFSPCNSPSLKRYRSSLPLSSVTTQDAFDNDLISPRGQRSVLHSR